MGKLKSRKMKRKLRNKVVLYVDGDVEIDYFRHIGICENSSLKLDIKKGDENKFFKEIYDEIPHMIILDIDAVTVGQDPKKRYENIKSLVEDHKTKDMTFFNNYSFETFLLNHVCKFTKPIYNSQDYDKHMRKHFDLKDSWSNKKNQASRNKMLSKIDEEALGNAKIRSKNLSNNCFRNPSSNMDSFFEKIKT